VQSLQLKDLIKLRDSELVIFGSGSTCEEFLNLLSRRGIRPKSISILDSFKEGFIQSSFGLIKIVKMTANRPVLGILVIATCQWNEVLDNWKDSLPTNFYLLSNELIHHANPIGQLGPFHIERELALEKRSAKNSILNSFVDSDSRDLYNLALELRTGMSEEIFFERIYKLVTSKSSNAKYGLLNSVEIFDYVIDGGIFDGSEISELAELLSEDGEYHGFDPNLHNIKSDFYQLTKKDYRIRFFETALWDSLTVLPFDSEKGAASGLRYKEETDNEGIKFVKTTVIDDHFKGIEGKNCLIKLDIEGAELAALRGGVEFFKNNRICFAVSMYHRAADLFDIPEFLLDLNKKFQFKIGISNPTFVDWVLYAFEH
jgi:FkbM family methyltransferase